MDLRKVILEAKDRRAEALEVKEWGVTVYMTELSALALDSWQEEVSRRKKDGDGMMLDSASLVARCMCDKDGNRIIGDDDLTEFSKKSGKVIKRLFDVALRVNGIGEDTVDELAKN